ncbi:MAG: lipid-binding protein [Bacteroidetes bacterium]|nr:MAG: lipid-binding protein [Bacteroidota bacterium]
MKKAILYSTVFSLLVYTVVSCKTKQTSVINKVGEAQELMRMKKSYDIYTVDVVQSKVNWKGSKPAGNYHKGSIAIEKGQIGLEKGKIKAGTFVLDMNTIAITGNIMDDQMKSKLVGHLNSQDFFEVEKHPDASFEITSTTSDSLTGNLTIKSISRSITVPYVYRVDESEVYITSSFSIDRTLWGITYSSGSYFDLLADYLINDDIEFEIDLQTRK